MKIREIDLDQEYDILKEWWVDRGQNPIPKEFLEGTHAIMTVDGDQDLSAGFIYFSDKGNVGLLNWVISNPAIKSSRRVHAAINKLYSFMEYFCKDAGRPFLLNSVKQNSGLSKLISRRGWVECPGGNHAYFLRCFNGN